MVVKHLSTLNNRANNRIDMYLVVMRIEVATREANRTCEEVNSKEIVSKVQHQVHSPCGVVTRGSPDQTTSSAVVCAFTS
eukprot:218931-Hanusia_phi.AAC.1